MAFDFQDILKKKFLPALLGLADSEYFILERLESV